MPKLLSLDQLLSNVAWRERFVALCLNDRPMHERNAILQWKADHLGGLRWQVISGFCREVSLMIYGEYLSRRSMIAAGDHLFVWNYL